MLLNLLISRAYATEMQSVKVAQKMAVRHLIASQQETGLFLYDFDLSKGKPSGRNNLVRQAGTLFSIAEYYSVYPTKDVESVLIKGLSTLDAYSTEFDAGQYQLVSGAVPKHKIRTGATALSLLSELLYYRTSGNGQFETARKKWLTGLLTLQINNKGFATTPKKVKESPYFSGEAWLALAHYVDIFEDEKLRLRLEKIDNYMMATYAQIPHIGFYHWGIMAAVQRYETTGQKKFLDFIGQQTKAFLYSLRPKFNKNSNTCYSLEGLIPAYQILKKGQIKDQKFLKKLKKRIVFEKEKNLRLQIKKTSTAKQEYIYGAFLAGNGKQYTRIDYTQHCLSAFLKTYM